MLHVHSMIGSVLGKRQLSRGGDDDLFLRDSSDRRSEFHRTEICEREAQQQQIITFTDLRCQEYSLIENLPQKLICWVISYIGPCSSSLVSLSGTSTMFHELLNDMGRKMLGKANFREPLQRNFLESDVSLFVRHTRACRDAYEKIIYLEQVVNGNIVSLAQINLNVKVAKYLLRLPCSRPLERRLLRACGKCGGMSFKYCKKIQDMHGLDKARLIMQLVLVRENQVANEIYEKEPNRDLHKQVNPATFGLLFKLWQARLKLYEPVQDTPGTIQTVCSRSVLIEDFF